MSRHSSFARPRSEEIALPTLSSGAKASGSAIYYPLPGAPRRSRDELEAKYGSGSVWRSRPRFEDIVLSKFEDTDSSSRSTGVIDEEVE